ncbi:hypothetical protein K4F52_002085 [Lecanicillium sp. MT-2017a]|nr:hypothetical protein K4F52_002085 [Lecanicillium sp. MT-2017a]
MSGAEVLGIISAIIAIIDATIQVSNAIQDEVGLPPNFKAAATKLPLITKLLDDAERYIENAADEALASTFTPVLTDCKEKATKLQQLFERVIQAEGDSRFECYVKAARTIGKGGRVETLMTGILGNLQLLATKFPETVSRRGQENLTKAIEEVSKMEPSLPDGFEDAPSFAHYGSGAQNVNTGDGSQYNNNSTGNQNNGPGNQFIGTNHIVLSTLANEDISIAMKPHFIVPFPRDSDFITRPMIQSWVREQLGGTASRIALTGMGGFGKSQIAIEVAHETQYSHPERSVFWVHGSTKAAFEESYRSLADRLALPRRHDPKVNILTLVRDWLQRDDVASWLLILDNADDLDVFFSHKEELPIASYLPKTINGKVLVTSRNLNVAEKLTGSHKAIKQVDTMGSNEALLLLQKKLTCGFDEDAAACLIRCLECIPLAVQQAAAYINRRCISIDTYIKRFQHSDKQQVKLLKHDGGDIRRHEGNV